MTTVHIYALFDPREVDHVRYIGKAEDLDRRLRQHIQAALNRNVERRCYDWIRDLDQDGVCPGIRIVRSVDLGEWVNAEREEILRHRELGHELTNATDGLDGSWFPDDDARERHRSRVIQALNRPEVRAALAKPKTESHKKALSRALLGHKPTAETVAKLSLARTGKRLSDEHRLKIAAGHLARSISKTPRQNTIGKARGASHGSAKISEEQAREIKYSGDTCSMLAERFGLSRSYISAIKRGIKWSHI